MRLDLLGYLAGALDGSEQDRIKQALDRDPQLRQQLSQLEEQLAPLEQLRWEEKPPLGLAERTCGLVQAHVERSKVSSQKLDRAMLWSQVERSGWRLVDMVVVAGILLATSMMLFPAIANSRHMARIQQCQDNLRQFGAAFPTWADRVNGRMPNIPVDSKLGVAGFYAPQLVEAGYMTEHQRFLCPSSDMAYQRNSFHVPTINQIRLSKGQQLISLQRNMGGSYLYGFGHVKNGQHHPNRIQGRAHFPVMSDQVASKTSRAVGPHGDLGVNVLFESGNVRFVVLQNRRTGKLQPYEVKMNSADLDAMFVSDRGMLEAGISEDDAVLAPSWARPIPVVVSN